MSYNLFDSNNQQDKNIYFNTADALTTIQVGSITNPNIRFPIILDGTQSIVTAEDINTNFVELINPNDITGNVILGYTGATGAKGSVYFRGLTGTVALLSDIQGGTGGTGGNYVRTLQFLTQTPGSLVYAADTSAGPFTVVANPSMTISSNTLTMATCGIDMTGTSLIRLNTTSQLIANGGITGPNMTFQNGNLTGGVQILSGVTGSTGTTYYPQRLQEKTGTIATLGDISIARDTIAINATVTQQVAQIVGAYNWAGTNTGITLKSATVVTSTTQSTAYFDIYDVTNNNIICSYNNIFQGTITAYSLGPISNLSAGPSVWTFRATVNQNSCYFYSVQLYY